MMVSVLTKVAALATVAALLLGQPAPAAGTAAAALPASMPAAAVSEAANTAGPYATAAQALAVADYLEDLGFYTEVLYRYGYWWVVFW
jgi:hypothetical protein